MSKIVTPYLDEAKIQQRIKALGQEISKDYQGRTLTCVGILKGSVLFFADLVRSLDLDVRFDFMSASSYGDAHESSGVVKINLDLCRPIQGQDVLLIEDIVDTGTTLRYLIENLSTRQPRSLKVCTLLSKPSRRKVDVPVDYMGFEIEDVFVVGYGLDDAERHRQLPYLGYIKT